MGFKITDDREATVRTVQVRLATPEAAEQAGRVLSGASSIAARVEAVDVSGPIVTVRLRGPSDYWQPVGQVVTALAAAGLVAHAHRPSEPA